MDEPERPLALPATPLSERPAARPLARSDAPPFARPTWLTYAQAGEQLGMSAEAVRHRARRSNWRTMPGNDGRTLVMIPDAIEPQPVRTPVQTADHTPDPADEIARAHARAERAEADRHVAEERADQAHKRADVAVALADRTLTRLAEAETKVEKLQDRLQETENRARAAEQAADELRQADAARRGQGRLARLRAAWRGE